VPTTEHFDPLFVALGATRPGDRLADVYTGFRHGSLSMRTVAWAPAA
jgi:aromatic ring-opening dioxygenase catalytic subunit (LigB family)